MSNVIHTIEGGIEARALAVLSAEARIVDSFTRALDDAVDAADAAAEAGTPIPVSQWEQARNASADMQAALRRKKRAGKKLRIVR